MALHTAWGNHISLSHHSTFLNDHSRPSPCSLFLHSVISDLRSKFRKSNLSQRRLFRTSSPHIHTHVHLTVSFIFSPVYVGASFLPLPFCTRFHSFPWSKPLQNFSLVQHLPFTLDCSILPINIKMWYLFSHLNKKPSLDPFQPLLMYHCSLYCSKLL